MQLPVPVQLQGPGLEDACPGMRGLECWYMYKCLRVYMHTVFDSPVSSAPMHLIYSVPFKVGVVSIQRREPYLVKGGH